MEQLTGRTAVVTGAASGIGRALASRLGEEGMRIVLADVEEDALATATAELAANGVEALGVVTDVSDAVSVDALAESAIERFGGVHVVCNNAGVSCGGLSWETEPASWAWVLGVNLWGVIHGVRTFVPRLIAQGEGHVVNTASVAGLRAAPFVGAYSASKHAVVAISETLHHELALLGSAVKVSALCPGWVNTRILESERNWLGRYGAAPELERDPQMNAGRELIRQQLRAGMEPNDVAGLVVDAIRAERFWILTDPTWADDAVARGESIRDGTNPSFERMG